MATNLAELEQRLQALEGEMASLRAVVNAAGGETCRLRDSSPADVSLAAVHHRMGISGEAPGFEQFRALLAAEGVLPGDEIVRQEIAAMRQQEEDE